MITPVPYILTKSSVEIYRFRAQGAPYWADVTIDSTPGSKAGRISITSDFGNWTSYWGACGETFKTFLARLDKNYLARNFGADRFFDAAETIRYYKEVAKDVYDSRSEKYKKVMDQIAILEGSAERREEFIIILQRDCPLIFEMYDGGPDLHTSLDPGFVNFWAHIWPQLLQAFEDEKK